MYLLSIISFTEIFAGPTSPTPSEYGIRNKCSNVYVVIHSSCRFLNMYLTTVML